MDKVDISADAPEPVAMVPLGSDEERREVIAALALQGLLAHGANDTAHISDTARRAVMYADALIEALDAAREGR
jgi:hypothetical protein